MKFLEMFIISIDVSCPFLHCVTRHHMLCVCNNTTKVLNLVNPLMLRQYKIAESTAPGFTPLEIGNSLDLTLFQTTLVNCVLYMYSSSLV